MNRVSGLYQQQVGGEICLAANIGHFFWKKKDQRVETEAAENNGLGSSWGCGVGGGRIGPSASNTPFFGIRSPNMVGRAGVQNCYGPMTAMSPSKTLYFASLYLALFF